MAVCRCVCDDRQIVDRYLSIVTVIIRIRLFTFRLIDEVTNVDQNPTGIRYSFMPVR